MMDMIFESQRTRRGAEDVDAREREKARLWAKFRQMEEEVDAIERDTQAWNEMHPEHCMNPDVSLLRAQLEEQRKGLPK